MALNLQNNLEDFLPRLLVSIPRISHSGGLGWGPRICFFNKFPSEAAAVDPRTTLWEPLIYYFRIFLEEKGEWITNSICTVLINRSGGGGMCLQHCYGHLLGCPPTHSDAAGNFLMEGRLPLDQATFTCLLCVVTPHDRHLTQCGPIRAGSLENWYWNWVNVPKMQEI